MAETVGLIAGSGELPLLIAGDARERGLRVAAVLLEHMADPALEGMAPSSRWINAGKLGSIIEYLKEEGATSAVIAGKIHKSLLFRGKILPDLRAMRVLLSLRDRRDDTIINAVAAEFLRDGVELLDMKGFCAQLLVPEGPLTRRKPGKSERADIAFGFRMAKGIGDLDIGQTVVVADGAVLAVEAIEGTDKCIRRGGELAEGKDAVVVKVTRPKQDLRFDIPVVGLDTLESMAASGCKVLAVEAGKTILLRRDEFIARADGLGIAVIGTSGKEDA